MLIHSTHSARIAQHVAALQQSGLDVAQSFARNSLPSLALERSDVRLFTPRTYRVLHRLGRGEGFANLGFTASSRQRFETFEEPFRSRIAASLSVQSALLQFFVALKLVNPTRSGKIERRGDIAAAIVTITGAEPAADWLNYSDWNNAWIVIELLRHSLGREFCPISVDLVSTWKVPAEASDLLPGTSFSTGNPQLEIVFPSEALSRKYKPKAKPKHVVAHEADLRQTLGEVLVPYLHDGRACNLHDFAAILETSPRSLQRKLKTLGVIYSDLLTQERVRLAIELMEGGDLSLAEISMAVGYSEQSNFTRAFAKVMGTTPGAWRRLHID